MSNFEQLEEEFRRNTVEFDEPDVTGAGTLDLAGRETTALLATEVWRRRAPSPATVSQASHAA
jgi:hypothetical protein